MGLCHNCVQPFDWTLPNLHQHSREFNDWYTEYYWTNRTGSETHGRAKDCSLHRNSCVHVGPIISREHEWFRHLLHSHQLRRRTANPIVCYQGTPWTSVIQRLLGWSVVVRASCVHKNSTFPEHAWHSRSSTIRHKRVDKDTREMTKEGGGVTAKWLRHWTRGWWVSCGFESKFGRKKIDLFICKYWKAYSSVNPHRVI